MIGAIVGDIVGSRFEFHNHKSKEFELFVPNCRPTDDSVMTLAVAKALVSCNGELDDLCSVREKAIYWMQTVGRHYPRCGYGRSFFRWIFSLSPEPYGSYGNGSAMRVSSCAFVARSLEQAKALSKAVTEVTHNHLEGIKGAEATTVAIYLAKTGSSLEQIRREINENYYPLDFTLDDIRVSYSFSSRCQDSVPQAIEAFLESTDFEDAIRNAVSIGGDSDTLAAIAGSIAEAFYGVPDDIRKKAESYLNSELLGILREFEGNYGGSVELKN